GAVGAVRGVDCRADGPHRAGDAARSAPADTGRDACPGRRSHGGRRVGTGGGAVRRRTPLRGGGRSRRASLPGGDRTGFGRAGELNEGGRTWNRSEWGS